ncbi:MAG: hypothetical protein QOK07_1714 [Gemmatimonadaceae bacterium]|nr:hypothetical protein [Gemmatimonadaceae bacterium]
MTESPRSYATRLIALLLGCFAAVMGFLAFNIVDGVFGSVEALIGLAAWIATTLFVYRRSPKEMEDASA